MKERQRLSITAIIELCFLFAASHCLCVILGFFLCERKQDREILATPIQNQDNDKNPEAPDIFKEMEYDLT